MNNRKRNRIVLAAWFAVFMLSGVGILLSHPIFELSSIEFQGLDMEGLEEIQMAASIEKDNIFLINLNRIERNLQELDRVRVCHARRVLPSTVQIVITEHTAELLVNLDEMVGLSEDGYFVPFRQHGSIADLPILTGLDNAVMVKEYQKTEEPVALLALKFLNDLCGVNPELKDLISEIRYDSNGFVVLLRDGSLPVYVGSATSAAENFGRFTMAYESIREKSDNLLFVDARFEDCLVLKHADKKWTS